MRLTKMVNGEKILMTDEESQAHVDSLSADQAIEAQRKPEPSARQLAAALVKLGVVTRKQIDDALDAGGN